MARIYKRLARYPGIWRVDGIGQAQSGGRLGARITAHFSGISEQGLNDPYRKLSHSGQTLSFCTHTASLLDFRVGTLWQEGRRIQEPPNIEDLLNVDLSNVRLVPMSASIKLGEQWAKSVIPENLFYCGENRSALLPTFYAIAPVLNSERTHVKGGAKGSQMAE